MIIHQDCYNKYYTVNFYEDHIEIEINFIPKDNFNKGKIYFDLVVYFMIDNTIIEYKGKIFHNEEESKKFLNVLNKFFIYNEIYNHTIEFQKFFGNFHKY